MWLFTGKGDSGETNLFNGSRVKKNEIVLDLIGGIDEVNSFIGLAISFSEDVQMRSDLAYLQDSLSKMMGIIAGAEEPSLFDFDLQKLLVWIEEKIGIYSRDIINPKAFTFPGKSKSGAIFDVCRTVTRRVERIAVNYSEQNLKLDTDFLTVINRLSSLFYILRLHAEEI